MSNFDSNIFINCPFSDDYKPILRVLIFGSVFFGYKPMIAETENGNIPRMFRIEKLMRNSKYSIHDISKMEFLEPNKLARFNMPFELGLDFGSLIFGIGKLKEKNFLILDSERHRYKKAISDLSGYDVEPHENNPEIALRRLRNWVASRNEKIISSANRIWQVYTEFTGDSYDILINKRGYSQGEIKEMPYSDYIKYIQEWLTDRPKN
ncbi:hypothetical protein [Flagellimonas algicola]|uniref:Uncharacterized protein n=1 Tax=Flagellimonas algicola TaxID=2583815 RepID=A0ABY2WS37_9FLAO|nr:hypothetical protein [Allomuricauda algicola]TMU57477.1 hypothetical protein FGG15_08015 [Allomuricauda algicola]